MTSPSATADCVHSWMEPGPQRLVFTIDAWQGLTDGLIQCASCGQYACVNLLEWGGRNLCYRVFAISELDADTTSVFLRNMNSDYCDPGRHRAEIEALFSATRPAQRVVLALVPRLIVIGSIHAGARKPKPLSWRESGREFDPAEQSWFPSFNFDSA